jgi:copper transport protein
MFQSLKKLFTNARLAAILIFAGVVAFAPSAVQAHAKLLKSQPADGAVLRQLPAAIELFFSTELQNASGMNSVQVTDRNGRRADRDNPAISDDGKNLRVELETLAAGVYTVEWRALSADDHSIKGKFNFTVAPTEATDAAAVVTTLPKNPPPDEQAGMNHETHVAESAVPRPQSAARWLAYLAMMNLFGGFAFWLFVLKPSLRSAESLNAAEKADAFNRGAKRFVKLAAINLALLALAAAAALVLQTADALDVSFSEAFAPSRWKTILTETVFGAPWLLQAAAILTLSAIIFFIARQTKNSAAANARATIWQIGFAVCALLFFAPGLSGHARAAASEYAFAIFADWLHLIAVGFWVGGLFQIVLTLPQAVAALEIEKRAAVQSRAVSLFSRLAVAAVIVTALTGVYNSWIHLDDFSDLWTTGYGTVLLGKTALFFVMLALGGLNSFVLRPRLEKSSAAENSPERNFYRSARVEALIGIVVLLLAAILAFLPPARRHEKSLNENGTEKSVVEKIVAHK